MPKPPPKKPSPEMIAAMEEDSGKGLENWLEEKYHWLGDLPGYDYDLDDPWLLAIRAIDEHQDKLPLTELLVSEHPLTSLARFFLADLIDRQTKFSKPGKRVPVYRPTPHQWKIHKSILKLKRLRRDEKLSVAQAAERLEPDTTLSQKLIEDVNRHADVIEAIKKTVTRRQLRNVSKRRPNQKKP